MAVQLILCDSAAAEPSGKVHILGAGWSVTGTPTPPLAVVALLKVPRDQAHKKLSVKLQLLDAHGQAIALKTPDGPEPILRQGEIDLSRSGGGDRKIPIDTYYAISVPPLPLPPGRYQWRLDLEGQPFTAFFDVLAVPGATP